MTKTHTTIRYIDGLPYTFEDIGCPDFDRAEQNRHMVKNQLFTTFYQEEKDWFEHSPLHAPLPDWIPTGSLPQISKKDWKQQAGFHEE